MNDVAMPEEWEILRQWLPDNLQERSRETGFMQRARGLQDAECWLRLILMHVAGGLSLQQTAVRARELGLAQVSSVALFKRLRKAERGLADRGYSHRAGVATVLAAKADVLLRWNPATFPVEGPQAQAWELLPRLRQLQAKEVGHWRVSFVFGGKRYGLRLCARRKSRTQAERARRKALRKAARNQSGTPDARSLELTQYVLVLTSVPEATLSAALVLELYRLRWQIELAF